MLSWMFHGRSYHSQDFKMRLAVGRLMNKRKSRNTAGALGHVACELREEAREGASCV